MRKNKKTMAIIFLSILVSVVFLSGCIDTVVTIGWTQGNCSSATLKGAAPAEYYNYHLVKVEFYFDNEHHSELELTEYSTLDADIKLENNKAVYFERQIYGLDPLERYYFRAVATYAVMDGNLPSVIYGEEINFSLTD